MEVKNSNGSCDAIETQKALNQTICYSILPLAYSRWGIMQNKDGIVSLLIFKDSMYWLSFQKQTDEK